MAGYRWEAIGLDGHPIEIGGPPSPAMAGPVSPMSSRETLKNAYMASTEELDAKRQEMASAKLLGDRKRNSQRRQSLSRPGPQFCYKPTALKAVFLTGMIVVLLGLIGLVEYSLLTLQAFEGAGDITDLFNQTLGRREADAWGSEFRRDGGDASSVEVDTTTTPTTPTVTPTDPSVTVTGPSTTETGTGVPLDTSSFLLGGDATFTTSHSVTRSMMMTFTSKFLQGGQSTFTTTESPVNLTPTPTSTPGGASTTDTSSTRGTTSFCFTCPTTTYTPHVITGTETDTDGGGGGYLTIGQSTITSPAEPSGGNSGGSVPANTVTTQSGAAQPPPPPPPPPPVTTTTPQTTQITTLAQTISLPDQTTVEQVTTLNSLGMLTTADVTTVLSGGLTTELTALTIGPNERLDTITAVLTSVIPPKVLTESTTFLGADGLLSTSVFETTESGTTATLTTIYPTIATISTSAAPTTTVSSAAASSSAPPSSPNVDVVVVGISYADYTMGAFLPTVLAVLVTIPLKLINVNAKLLQPFHALASNPHGAAADESIFLRFYGWPGLMSLPRAVWLRQPVVVASEILVCGTALLAPIAAEAVAVHLDDFCPGGQCYGALGVAPVPARTLQALLGAMVLALLVLLILLISYSTGVRQNPWSLAGMAALGLDSRVRKLLGRVPRGLTRKVEDSEVRAVLVGQRYGLDQIATPGFAQGYGLVVEPRHDRSNDDDSDDDSRSSLLYASGGQSQAPSSLEFDKAGQKRVVPFAMLTWWGRCLLIFFLSSVLTILAYYENSFGDSGFEEFMDSQGFGVRFFFTALGVVLGFCMATFFRCVAVLSPYLQLSRHPMPAERSILLSPATNPFYGMYSATCQRHLYLGVVAFTAVLADFLPVTLAHVPFSLIETYETQLVCAWLSIAILGLMILVIGASFLIRWPHMPVDPRTIAGALFYVSDSWMLGSLEGLSAAGKRDRDHVIRGMRSKYGFGYMHGMSGRESVGIDIIEQHHVEVEPQDDSHS